MMNRGGGTITAGASGARLVRTSGAAVSTSAAAAAAGGLIRAGEPIILQAGENIVPVALTIDTEMRLRDRIALAWRILRHRRVTFTVRGAERNVR